MSQVGEVLVEGAYVGRIEGLRFVPDSVDGVEMRMLIAAASRVLRGEITARTRLLATDADQAFAIGTEGELRWRGEVVGRMVAGEKLMTPRVEPSAADFIEGRRARRCAGACRNFCAAKLSVAWGRFLLRRHCR
jgi:ATP-dependent RNA helicase SUPV3L1/SUV3